MGNIEPILRVSVVVGLLWCSSGAVIIVVSKVDMSKRVVVVLWCDVDGFVPQLVPVFVVVVANMGCVGADGRV